MVARKGFRFASVIVIAVLETFLKMFGFIRISCLFEVALIAFNVLGETVDGREFHTAVSLLLPE